MNDTATSLASPTIEEDLREDGRAVVGTQTCGNCKFFQLLITNVDGSKYGSCRYMPPPAQPMTKWRWPQNGTGVQQVVPQAISVWPRVMADEWCGQWQQ